MEKKGGIKKSRDGREERRKVWRDEMEREEVRNWKMTCVRFRMKKEEEDGRVMKELEERRKVKKRLEKVKKEKDENEGRH